MTAVRASNCVRRVLDLALLDEDHEGCGRFLAGASLAQKSADGQERGEYGNNERDDGQRPGGGLGLGGGVGGG